MVIGVRRCCIFVFGRDLKPIDRAVTALEYGLIAGIIVAVITAGFKVLATSVSARFSAIGNSL